MSANQEESRVSIVCPRCFVPLRVDWNKMPPPLQIKNGLGWWLSCGCCNHYWWYPYKPPTLDSPSHGQSIQKLRKIIGEFDRKTQPDKNFFQISPSSKLSSQKIDFFSKDDFQSLKESLIQEIKTELVQYTKTNILNDIKLKDPRNRELIEKKERTDFFPKKKWSQHKNKKLEVTSHPIDRPQTSSYSYRRVLPQEFSHKKLNSKDSNSLLSNKRHRNFYSFIFRFQKLFFKKKNMTDSLKDKKSSTKEILKKLPFESPQPELLLKEPTTISCVSKDYNINQSLRQSNKNSFFLKSSSSFYSKDITSRESFYPQSTYDFSYQFYEPFSNPTKKQIQNESREDFIEPSFLEEKDNNLQVEITPFDKEISNKNRPLFNHPLREEETSKKQQIIHSLLESHSSAFPFLERNRKRKKWKILTSKLDYSTIKPKKYGTFEDKREENDVKYSETSYKYPLGFDEGYQKSKNIKFSKSFLQKKAQNSLKNIKSVIPFEKEQNKKTDINSYIAVSEEGKTPFVIPLAHEEDPQYILPPLIPDFKNPKIYDEIKIPVFSIKKLEKPEKNLQQKNIYTKKSILTLLGLIILTLTSVILTYYYKDQFLYLWDNFSYNHKTSKEDTPLLLEHVSYTLSSIQDLENLKKVTITGEIVNNYDYSLKIKPIFIKIYPINSQILLYSGCYFHKASPILPHEHSLFRIEKSIPMNTLGDLRIELSFFKK